MKCPANLFILFLLSGAVLHSSCEKAIPIGTEISVSGEVRDMVKNKRLPNAKLYVFGANRTLSGTYYSIGPVDSVVSDASGRFTILFKTHGYAMDYGLRLGMVEYGGVNYGAETNYVADPAEPIYKFNTSRQISNAVVRARELNFTRVELRVLNNPFDTFLVRSSADIRRVTLLRGQSIDTTIVLRHLPMAQNRIEYYTEARRDTAGLAAANANPNGPFTSIRRMVRDTIQADLRDTIFIRRVINNSLEMPRQ